jgi:hypothetical protein
MFHHRARSCSVAFRAKRATSAHELPAADAHPDRGGTAEQFIQARRRYQTVLRLARGYRAHLAGNAQDYDLS